MEVSINVKSIKFLDFEVLQVRQEVISLNSSKPQPIVNFN